MDASFLAKVRHGTVFLPIPQITIMKRSAIFPVFAVLLTLSAANLAGCGQSDDHVVHTHADSVAPSTADPDANSANNPSLADTAYEGNRTRPITDTMHTDTMKKK
jgi:hypothetical protein